MSVKPETRFTKSIHDQHALKEVYHEKMNNPFRSGGADIWYSGVKSDYWIEYKYEPSLPKSTKNYELKLSERQKKWLRERHEEGRNVAVILGLPEGGVIFEALDWEKAELTTVLRQNALSRLAVAEWILAHVGTSPCKRLSGRSKPSP